MGLSYMFIRGWSNDLEMGIEDIDQQNKKLFETLNLFAFKQNFDFSKADLMMIIQYMVEYATDHFAAQEAIMREKEYPLLQYHADLHSTIKDKLEQLKELLESDQLSDPLERLLDIANELMNIHIAQDDFSFIRFCNETYSLMAKSIEGCKCEITSMNNVLLGTGKIERVDPSQIVIANDGFAAIYVGLNDLVKVVLVDPDLKIQVLIARVFVSKADELKLFNEQVVHIFNERKFVRVPTKIETTIGTEGGTVKVIIADISIGGMLLLSQAPLSLHEKITIHFPTDTKTLSIPAKIVRVIKNSRHGYKYGCRFAARRTQIDIIAKFVMERQQHMRLSLKKENGSSSK